MLVLATNQAIICHLQKFRLLLQRFPLLLWEHFTSSRVLQPLNYFRYSLTFKCYNNDNYV